MGEIGEHFVHFTNLANKLPKYQLLVPILELLKDHLQTCIRKIDHMLLDHLDNEGKVVSSQVYDHWCFEQQQP